MKRNVFSMLIVSGLALSANATVRTVSNNVNSPGQYTSVQAAHDASAVNDTLYIHASDVTYGNLTLDRTLVIIGEGALPNKQIQYETRLNLISMTYAPFPATTSANGSKLYGLSINTVHINNSSAAGTSGIGGVTFSRNKITLVYLFNVHSGLLFNQNVISALSQVSGSQGVLNNCVFSNNLCTSFQPIITAGSSNLISNNIFETTFNARGAVVSNNIFYNYVSAGAIGISTLSCSFSNNIFYAFTPVVEANVISGSNTGSGNLFNVDPVYVYPSTPGQIMGYSYSAPVAGPFANLQLGAGSPGINYGTDGTDVGLYGGGYPWVDGTSTDTRFRYFPMSKQVPHMIEMNILNPTIPSNGTLNVEFNAKTQN